MKKAIIKKIYELNTLEAAQLSDKKFHPDFADKTLLNNSDFPIFTNDFFKGQQVYISKHNRFFDYPAHTHTFLEVNYVLRGTAIEIINGTEIKLDQGDLVILDIGTTHEIKKLSYDDLLINIIFSVRPDKFNIYNDNFGVNLNKLYFSHLFSDHYLLLRDRNTDKDLRIITELLIQEYLDHKETITNSKIIASYTDLFFELVFRNVKLSSKHNYDSAQEKIAMLLLREIIDNYNSISLSILAEKYNYNRNYLSNIFKKEMGLGFIEALNNRKLSMAYDQLITTNNPIDQIITQVGFSNKTFFYKKFEEKYLIKPAQVRKSNRLTLSSNTQKP